MSELAPFESRLTALLASTAPAGRRVLARTIATRLRASQAKRIGDQQNPDGTPYAPRKPQRLRRKKGFIHRKMFTKLRTTRWLKIDATPEAAVIAFAGEVQRMAQVHQRGLRERVGRTGPEVTYPARQLLGLTEAEIGDIEDAVLAHIAGA